jgi:adenosylcobinamide-GDP ribazoletransferase
MKPFLIALQFLTRLPVRLRDVPDREVGRSLLYYPVVGALLGAALAALGVGLDGAPALLRAAIVLCAWVLLTGALHLDGLADSADAWVGGRGDRERTLSIMKDPHCGPAAVVVLALVLLLKFTALVELAGDWGSLILVPALARAAVVLLFLSTPYVRPGGLGAALAAYAPRNAGVAVIVATLASASLLGATRAAAVVIACVGAFLLGRRAMRERLGGTTGDTAGALIEIVETAALVAIAVFVRH